jgi:hypothetical protein
VRDLPMRVPPITALDLLKPKLQDALSGHYQLNPLTRLAIELSKESEGSMIPFSDLQKLADAVHEETGLYTAVHVEYGIHSTGDSSLAYNVWIRDEWHYFPSVQDLQQFMENIIKPPVTDEGVSL